MKESSEKDCCLGKDKPKKIQRGREREKETDKTRERNSSPGIETQTDRCRDPREKDRHTVAQRQADRGPGEGALPVSTGKPGGSWELERRPCQEWG